MENWKRIEPARRRYCRLQSFKPHMWREQILVKMFLFGPRLFVTLTKMTFIFLLNNLYKPNGLVSLGNHHYQLKFKLNQRLVRFGFLNSINFRHSHMHSSQLLFQLESMNLKQKIPGTKSDVRHRFVFILEDCNTLNMVLPHKLISYIDFVFYIFVASYCTFGKFSSG